MGMLEGEVEGGDDEEDEPEAAPAGGYPAPAAKGAAKAKAATKADKKGTSKEDKKEEEKEEKEKNWSAVNLSYIDSKLPFKGAFSPAAFTNWSWYRTVRPKLAASKGTLPDIDSKIDYGIDAVESVLGECAPKMEEPKEDKKDKK